MEPLKIVLGSKSPRRQSLVLELGYDVEVRTAEVDEIYPDNIAPTEVPAYLAKLKAMPLVDSLQPGELLITSDTVVILGDTILGKPVSREDAIEMLQQLSGRSHEVITGVSLTMSEKSYTFSTITKVTFSKLTMTEIIHYIDEYKPFDKAGAYGIQEWIGYIGVERIEGCYYNVVGLPVHDLYHTIQREFLPD